MPTLPKPTRLNSINLFKKYNLDPQQISPKCNKCGATMILKEGKNGAFWACPNYKANGSGCNNTYDLKIVDVKGNVNARQTSTSQEQENDLSLDEIDLDNDIPF